MTEGNENRHDLKDILHNLDHSQCLIQIDHIHFRSFPEYQAYITPVFFQSDWMNEFWDVRTDTTDDYRFVYIGPKGSW